MRHADRSRRPWTTRNVANCRDTTLLVSSLRDGNSEETSTSSSLVCLIELVEKLRPVEQS